MLEMEYDCLVVIFHKDSELFLCPIINTSLELVPPIRRLESFLSLIVFIFF